MAKTKKDDVYVGPRACKGYNPIEHLIDIPNITTGEMGKYLLVPDRVTWFNAYCQENGIDGVIDDSQIEVHFEANRNLVVAVCVIYMNGKEIAKSVGSGVFHDGDDIIFRKAVECAATSAKGRALANAGFGSNMSTGDEPEQGLVDAPVSEKPNKEQKTTAEKTPDAKKEAVKLPETVAEAQQVVLDFGEYKGKTLGEVFVLSRSFVEWLATKYNASRHPEYKKAAEIILKTN